MTAFIADACALIVFHGPKPGGPKPGGMSPDGAEALRTGEVHVSPVTVWEIERKALHGSLPRPVPPRYRGTFADFLRESGYRVAPFSWDDAAAAAALPDHHRDPMDRMLIATALRMDLTIVTSDRVFRSYGVRTIW